MPTKTVKQFLDPMTKLQKKVYNHVSWRSKLMARRTFNRLAKIYWQGQTKGISAMMRVRNEEEFLLPSVLSIADLVDEVVIIDNLSNDRTAEIIKQLQSRLASKLKAFAYPHVVSRMGEDYHVLQRKDPGSSGLLHNYYNWCLSRCTMPFIMKWDGDMIAMDAFAPALAEFKQGGFLQFDFGGYNITSDRQNLITLNAVIEPRVYPKLWTSFSYQGCECETLGTWVVRERTQVVSEPLYIHMKYCKRVPTANFSTEYGMGFVKHLTVGEPVPTAVKEALAKWQVG